LWFGREGPEADSCTAASFLFGKGYLRSGGRLRYARHSPKDKRRPKNRKTSCGYQILNLGYGRSDKGAFAEQADKPRGLITRSHNLIDASWTNMQFFLYEIVARIVAIYLCVYFIRKVRSGLVERKITYYLFNTDFLDSLLLDRSRWVADRDATPVRYWIQIGIHIQMSVGCLLVAILGWWHPNT
jgi:hypothetical protein